MVRKQHRIFGELISVDYGIVAGHPVDRVDYDKIYIWCGPALLLSLVNSRLIVVFIC